MKRKNRRYVGQRYINAETGVDYILAQTATSCVSLICLDNGNRYNEGVQVANILKISKEEWKQITGGVDFLRYIVIKDR